MRRLAPLAALLLLAGCAGGLGGGPLAGRSRERPPLPPAAQPTSVVATELAFARAAREGGQWSAYRQFAAAGAQVQGDGATDSVESWLAGRAEPAVPDRWVPRQAWASCDGSSVVVAGLSTDVAGNWGRFTRVWERQADGDFRWTFSQSLPDAALTAARRERERQRAADEALGEDAILVEEASFIRARVADCTSPPPQPAGDVGTASRAGVGMGLSRDRTLRWSWTSPQDEGGRFTASSWNGTGWDEILPGSDGAEGG